MTLDGIPERIFRKSFEKNQWKTKKHENLARGQRVNKAFNSVQEILYHEISSMAKAGVETSDRISRIHVQSLLPSQAFSSFFMLNKLTLFHAFCCLLIFFSKSSF